MDAPNPPELPELIVFDVDGTLVDLDGHCSVRTGDVLARLRRASVPIALATGRPLAVARETLHVVGGADWLICGNGAWLQHVATKELLRGAYLPSEIVAPLIVEMRRQVPGIGFAVELHGQVIEERGFARRVPPSTHADPVDDVLRALDALDRVARVIAFHDDYDDRLPALAAFAEPLVDERCQVQMSGLPLIDVSCAGDHKAVALDALVDLLDVRADMVLAFGDGRNDIEMLRWAGTGVAMGSAEVEVYAAADHVTDAVEADGVAAFLEPLLDRHGID